MKTIKKAKSHVKAQPKLAPVKEPVFRCSLLRCDVRGGQCLSSCALQMRVGGCCPDFNNFVEWDDKEAVSYVAQNLDNLNSTFKFAFHDVVVRAKHLMKTGEYKAPPEKEKKTMDLSTKLAGIVAKTEPAAQQPAEPVADSAAPSSEPAPTPSAPTEPVSVTPADDNAGSTEPQASVSSEPPAAPKQDEPPAPPADPAAATEPTPAPSKRTGRKAKNEKDPAMPRGVYARKPKADASAAPATKKPRRVATKAAKVAKAGKPLISKRLVKDGSVTLVLVNGAYVPQSPKEARTEARAEAKLRKAHAKAVKALTKQFAGDVVALGAELTKLGAAQAAELAALPKSATIKVPAASFGL
jgi:hypothetical protein